MNIFKRRDKSEPGQVLVIAARGPFRKLAARVMALPGDRVYRRDDAEGTTTTREDGGRCPPDEEWSRTTNDTP